MLARAGVGSRRQVEAWIKEGRLAVNGSPASPGAHISPRDKVTLDGRPVRIREPDSDTRVILYHRAPRRAPGEGESEEAIDLSAKLPKRAGRRWISISPLPPNDGGLELLTSDGDLAQALMRKLATLTVEFAIRVRGEPTLGQMVQLKAGVLDDKTLEIESVVPAGGEGFNRWLKLVTRGARARDVHRLCTSVGLQLSRLMRVAIGPLVMDRALARERTQPLDGRETEALYALAGVVPSTRTDRSRKSPRKLKPKPRDLARSVGTKRRVNRSPRRPAKRR